MSLTAFFRESKLSFYGVAIWQQWYLLACPTNYFWTTSSGLG